LQYDILIPGGKVLRACGDGRFSHRRCNLQCGTKRNPSLTVGTPRSPHREGGVV
jgi:hypothetical protein